MQLYTQSTLTSQRMYAVSLSVWRRVPMNKQERGLLKTARRGGMAGGALLDDFADEIGHLVQVWACFCHVCEPH